MSYRQWTTPDGWAFCFATAPSFVCPVVPDRDEDGRWIVTPAIAQAAELLGGCEPYDLARLLGSRSQHGQRRRDERDRLVDRCAACGAKLRKVGVRAWVERPPAEDELDTGDRIGLRIFGNPRARTVRTVMADTRREARQWAYDEYRDHKAELTGQTPGATA